MKVLIYCLVGLVYMGQIKAQAQNDEFTFIYALKNFPLYVNVDNPIIFTNKKNDELPEHLKFSVNNGKVIHLEGTSRIIITPKNISPLILKVKNKKGKVIVKRKYEVLPIPIPNIIMTDENNEKLLSGIPISGQQIVKLQANSTSLLSLLNPESSYLVQELEIKQFRGSRVISKKKQNSSIIDLAKLGTRPGDAIQIKVSHVGLVDKNGKTQRVPIDAPFVSFFIK